MATAAAAYAESAERRGWQTAHTVLLGLIVVAIGVVGISLPRSGGQLGFIGQRAVLAWLLIAGLMAAFAAVAGHGVTGFARGVLIDERHRVTLGRLQMLIWTVLVLSAYLAAALANIGRGAASPLERRHPERALARDGDLDRVARRRPGRARLQGEAAPGGAAELADRGRIALLRPLPRRGGRRPRPPRPRQGADVPLHGRARARLRARRRRHVRQDDGHVRLAAGDRRRRRDAARDLARGLSDPEGASGQRAGRDSRPTSSSSSRRRARRGASAPCPLRNSAMYASKSHLSRNFSAAQRPES